MVSVRLRQVMVAVVAVSRTRGDPPAGRHRTRDDPERPLRPRSGNGQVCLRAEDIAEDGLNLTLAAWKDLVDADLAVEMLRPAPA
jgi:hypothetical protein